MILVFSAVPAPSRRIPFSGEICNGVLAPLTGHRWQIGDFTPNPNPKLRTLWLPSLLWKMLGAGYSFEEMCDEQQVLGCQRVSARWLVKLEIPGALKSVWK
jgi:hypothetical protein